MAHHVQISISFFRHFRLFRSCKPKLTVICSFPILSFIAFILYFRGDYYAGRRRSICGFLSGSPILVVIAHFSSGVLQWKRVIYICFFFTEMFSPKCVRSMCLRSRLWLSSEYNTTYISTRNSGGLGLLRARMRNFFLRSF